MRAAALALVPAALFTVSAADAGERRSHADQSFDAIVLISGGVPTLEIRTNRDDTACVFAAGPGTKAKRTKSIFTLY